MIKKTCLFIVLILNIVALKEKSNIINPSKATFDEIITGDGEKIFSYSVSKTYLIKRESSTKKYFEITNFYASYELLKGDNVIYKEEQTTEESNYFFVHDGSEYYIKMTKGNTAGGIKIRSGNKQFDLLLTSSLDLIVFSERSFEISLENDKNYPQLLCITIPYIFRLVVESILFEENENAFTPIDYKIRSSDNLGYSYYYYLILTDIITINLKLKADWSSTKTRSTTFQIKIDNSNIIDISSNEVYCTSKGSKKFFNINSNSYSHYEITMNGNSEIYYLKNNEEKTQLQSFGTYSKNYNYIYADATSSKTCFYIYFLNEKFIINDNSTYSLYLFDSRTYEITIKNSKATYFHLNFKENYYLNLTKIELLNQDNSELKPIYLNPNYYYVYQFERQSDEIPIKLYIEKIRSFTDYQSIEFDFYAYTEKIKNIDNDYFECISDEKYFHIIPNSNINKPYLHLRTNNTKKVLINGQKLENEIMNIKDDKIYYLNVIGEKERPIYIYLFYTEKKEFEIKKNDKYKLSCYDDMNYEFTLVDLKVGYEIILRLESTNKNIRFYSMNLKGANKAYIGDIKNPDNIKITPNQNQVIIDLRVKNDNKLSIEEFTFYFYSEKSTDYKVLLSTAKVFAYICFAIVVVPFIVVCYCSGLGNNKEIKDEEESYFLEKFAAIYFCKKFDKVN